MEYHGTTILAVRHHGKAAVAGDGQVTLDKNVVKHHAKKVRRIYNDQIIVGFAGATADALNLSERLEEKLERYNGNLTRSAVELARDWRTDKYLRRLEAIMVAVDEESIYLISGNYYGFSEILSGLSEKRSVWNNEKVKLCYVCS